MDRAFPRWKPWPEVRSCLTLSPNPQGIGGLHRARSLATPQRRRVASRLHSSVIVRRVGTRLVLPRSRTPRQRNWQALGRSDQPNIQRIFLRLPDELEPYRTGRGPHPSRTRHRRSGGLEPKVKIELTADAILRRRSGGSRFEWTGGHRLGGSRQLRSVAATDCQARPQSDPRGPILASLRARSRRARCSPGAGLRTGCRRAPGSRQ
jgi:hypothetical protein